MFNIIIYSSISFLISTILTHLVIKVAIKKEIFAVPTKRSSHNTYIPNIGGVAIFISYLFMLLVLNFTISIDQSILLILCSAGSIVLLVGLYDDIRDIKVRYRILTHIVVSILAVFFLDKIILFDRYFLNSLPSLLILFFSVLIIISFINIYNFMDGADGYMSIGAIIVSTTVGMFLYNDSISILFFLLSASIMGFLLFNMPKAKVFMGDTGSTFIGFVLAVLMLYSITYSNISIWTWGILISPFFMDAFITILTKMLTGQKWFRPHRHYTFQKIIDFFIKKTNDRTKAHRMLSICFILYNVIILLPMAYISVKYVQYNIYICILSIIPIVVLALVFKTGRK